MSLFRNKMMEVNNNQNQIKLNNPTYLAWSYWSIPRPAGGSGTLPVSPLLGPQRAPCPPRWWWSQSTGRTPPERTPASSSGPQKCRRGQSQTQQNTEMVREWRLLEQSIVLKINNLRKMPKSICLFINLYKISLETRKGFRSGNKLKN